MAKSTSAEFSIVITNFNGKRLLERNLPTVAKAYENKKNCIYEVIVVDDGSTDDSCEFIKSSFLFIKLVKHKINRGFISATNTGVRSSKSKFVVLLNNDVSVNPDFLVHVSKHFKDPQVFAVSLNESGYGPAKGNFENGFIVYSAEKAKSKSSESFWASGGSAVFRRDMWVSLGGMDEKLLSPFYWEDVDVSYRAQKRGWKILWDPKAKVVHNHESTVSKISVKYRQRIQERNQLIFIWKNLTSNNLFKKHLAGLLARLTKHPGYIVIIIMALVKWRNIKKARRLEKKESKVSDEAIFA